MRKYVGLLCAAALIVPAAVISTAGPAAAAPVVTCTKAAGSATFTPALPPLSSTKKVKSKLAATGTLGGCTGSGGVKSATTTFKQTSASTPSNCTTLSKPDPKSKGTIGTLTIKWNKGPASTVKALTIKQTPKVVDSTITGKITAGQFVGKTFKGFVTYTLPKGACSSKPLSKVTYKETKGKKGTVG
jgi:hypothetical protein